MEKLIKSLARVSRIRLFFLLWITAEIFTILFVSFFVFLESDSLFDTHENAAVNPEQNDLFDNPLFVVFLLLVVFAPIVETLLFQVLLLNLTKKATFILIRSASWLPAFVITSILFAYSHTMISNSFSDLSNFVSRIPAGIILTLLAIVEREREKGNAFVAVACLHGLHNFSTFVVLMALEVMFDLEG